MCTRDSRVHAALVRHGTLSLITEPTFFYIQSGPLFQHYNNLSSDFLPSYFPFLFFSFVLPFLAYFPPLTHPSRYFAPLPFSFLYAYSLLFSPAFSARFLCILPFIRITSFFTRFIYSNILLNFSFFRLNILEVLLVVYIFISKYHICPVKRSCKDTRKSMKRLSKLYYTSFSNRWAKILKPRVRNKIVPWYSIEISLRFCSK